MVKNPKKIRLMGKGKGYELTPDNDDFELWGLNGHLFDIKKLDKIFMMDVLDEMPSVVSGTWEVKDMVEKLNELKIPLVSPYRYEEIPMSEAFPLNEAVREFGIPYFNNTIAYMICYALLKGVQELQLWGINQASATEYFYEKGCVEYWLGIATGLGVRVSIHGKWSELLINKDRYGGNKLYGYNVPYEAIMKSFVKFGEPIVRKLLAPPEGKISVLLGPEKSRGLKSTDILGIKKLWQTFASLPTSQWIISLDDAYNIARLVVDGKPKRVLDLGTGIGTSAAVVKYVDPQTEVISIEQFPKIAQMARRAVKDLKVVDCEAETFSSPEIPGQLFSGYKDLPKGLWQLVIVDGPGPFIEKDALVDYPNGDVFRILDEIEKDGLVYVDGRKDSVKLMRRYLGAFLIPVMETGGYAIFKRTSQLYQKELVVDSLLDRLKKQNYF